MRRIVFTLLLATVVAGSLPGVSSAAKGRKKVVKVERPVTSPYDAPAIGLAGTVSAGNCGAPNTGCARFVAGTNERYLSISITDTSGQKASGVVTIDSQYGAVHFCGETAAPFEVTPGTEITVWVHMGPSFDPGAPASTPCPGVATSGTIKGTFSNVP